MAKYKRPFGVVAGPLLVVLALAGFWGYRSAQQVKYQVESWAYQFENTSEPVTMDMPDIPMIPPLYVNGDRIGRVESVVLMRGQVNSLDSLAILASVGEEYIERLEGCALRLRLRSVDLHGYTDAFRCTRNIGNLRSFGHLRVEGTDLTVPIMVRESDLPCAEGKRSGACNDIRIEVSRELRTMERDLERQKREMAVELRNGARELRLELQQVKAEVRETVRRVGR